MNIDSVTASAKQGDNKPATAIATTPAQAEVVIPRTLFNTDLFFNSPTVAKSFGVRAILSKEGSVVGASMTMVKRKDLASALDLKGKENAEELDGEIRKAKLEAWQKFKVWLLSQPDDKIGLHALRTRDLKSGRRHTLAIDELAQKALVTIEKFAAAHGLTVDEVSEFLATHKKPTINVGSTVTPADKK